ncbi:hypothetical protein J2808_001954 [Pseudarthrobacter sulfonivorans]|nr:hypothetical protein [Pseudarthrobacter sulfonivorans]
MVDLFFVAALVGNAINTVEGPGAVFLVEVLVEVRAAEEVVVPTVFFVPQLTDLDRFFAIAIDFDLEIDFVTAKILWIPGVYGTAMTAGFRLDRGSQCHGTPQQTQ